MRFQSEACLDLELLVVFHLEAAAGQDDVSTRSRGGPDKVNYSVELEWKMYAS